jgi:UDP:flavonoid glycosyltransferase YjiC (YdhE family)
MAGLGPHDARRLRTAIESVLADGSYRRAAEGIADELGALPTVDELLATIAREVAGASRECSEHP